MGWFLRLSSLFLFLVLTCFQAKASQPDPKAIALAREALALLEQGKPDEALELLLEAYELEPEPRLLGYFGRAYELKGDLEQALDYYERWLRTETDERARDRARQKVEELQTNFGTVIIGCSPPDARVELDGLAVNTANPAYLKPGTYTIVVTAPGYKPHRRVVKVSPGKITRELITLQEKPGRLLVNGPVGARVLVNQENVGTLPMAQPYELEPGEHIITVVAEGFEHWTTTVRIKRDSRTTINADLVPLSKPTATPVEDATRISIVANISGLIGFIPRKTRVFRSHSSVESGLTMRFTSLPWLAPDLTVWLTVEKPQAVAIRPSMRWYLGTLPIYFRTGCSSLVSPTRAVALLGGFGADIPLWEDGHLRLEAITTSWIPHMLTAVDFGVGIGHAF